MNLELSLFDLLLMYGLTFGIMNKIPQIHNRAALLDSLFTCSYCTGFHVGWMLYLVNIYSTQNQLNLISLICWGFISSAWCYIADTFVEYLENN